MEGYKGRYPQVVLHQNRTRKICTSATKQVGGMLSAGFEVWRDGDRVEAFTLSTDAVDEMPAMVSLRCSCGHRFGDIASYGWGETKYSTKCPVCKAVKVFIVKNNKDRRNSLAL